MAAIGALAILTLLFQGLMPGGGIVETGVQDGRAMVILQQGANGHYVSAGKINGLAVTMLVDTGATDVVIPNRLARELDLEFGLSTVVMTAAGPLKAWMTRLDSVSIGAVSRRNVRATITSGPLDEVLLGMSFLKYFSLSQQGDRLIISGGDETRQ